MTALATTLQAFFTDRLARQRQVSPNTLAAYRDTLRLLLVFAADKKGKEPSKLDIDDLDAPLIGDFRRLEGHIYPQLSSPPRRPRSGAWLDMHDLGYPFNRTWRMPDGWSDPSPASTTLSPLGSFGLGSRPMRTASTTWNG